MTAGVLRHLPPRLYAATSAATTWETAASSVVLMAGDTRVAEGFGHAASCSQLESWKGNKKVKKGVGISFLRRPSPDSLAFGGGSCQVQDTPLIGTRYTDICCQVS